MALAAGTKLGPYEILSPLGAGGMGEVYRARDTRLGRDLAIKVLPEAFAADPQRMGRFEREAQVLASLNHPNIAAIYELEESGSTRALAMELVAGPTLAERLAGGVGAGLKPVTAMARAIPLDEALPIAKQIAEALEYAHERGIIHRDLKPANVKVTPEGTVKVLDFGLAKALASPTAAGTAPLQDSPTLTAAATQAGVIIGTAAYMAPEQAKGKAVDRRADIWAFGCVLYEMLTGRQCFEGETVSDVLAAVIRAEPDWAALPEVTPVALHKLLRRCLVKDPKQRLRDIGEARIAIEEFLSGADAAPPLGPLHGEEGKREARGGGWRRALPWALTGFFALALVGSVFLWRTERPVPLPLMKFALTLPAGDLPFGSGEAPGVALSLDGTKMVYTDTRAPAQLYLRRLDTLQANPIPGTEGGQAPFFSPDGRWIGFFGNGKLKKVSIDGGTPIILADAQITRGATWAPDGTIIFSPSVTSGLMRVSDSGGNVESLTTPKAAAGERTHRWPEVLPGGKAVLFLIGKLTSPTYFDDSQVAVLSLETGKYRVVLEHAAMARYGATSDSSGYLVYAHSGDLLAAPFDLKRLEVTGRAVPVIQGVSEVVGNGSAHFALSQNGLLAYLPGGPENENGVLTWMDRKGTEHPTSAPPRPFEVMSLSPDGQRVAVESYSTMAGALASIWDYDFIRNTLTRLTFAGDNEGPLWAPDGKRVAYYSPGPRNPGLYWKPPDGSQPPELLAPMIANGAPTSFSPDGRFLAFVQVGAETGADIWVLPLQGERKPYPFAHESFNEGWASFSPDGRWLAYMSDESGQQEIYVRAFPGPGGKWQVSSGGGNYPLWAKSGREIFYVNGDKLMSAPVETSPSFSVGTSRMLFEKAALLLSTQAFGRSTFLSKPFDVAPDGQRFLIVKHSVSAPTQLNLVQNWFVDLKRLAADGKQ